MFRVKVCGLIIVDCLLNCGVRSRERSVNKEGKREIHPQVKVCNINFLFFFFFSRHFMRRVNCVESQFKRILAL